MDSRHARVELALSLAVIMLAGCRYSAGSLSYAANPELKPVTLYKGAPSDVGRDVGPVETYMRGRSSCTDHRFLFDARPHLSRFRFYKFTFPAVSLLHQSHKDFS